MPSGAERARIVVAYGTRPEAIKLAPVVLELAASESLEPVVVVSGQHREMVQEVERLFGIRPAHDLGILLPGQTLSNTTSRALSGFSAFFDVHEVDAVAVQGDTTTTLAAALAAFYHQIPVVHVEAGLRSGDPRSPYPEEVNRRVVSQLTTLHLAPTEGNRLNLRREGFAGNNIRVTGNTVIDAFLSVSGMGSSVGHPVIDASIADGRRILLVTAHRREAWGPTMKAIGTAVAEVARRWPDVLVVVPAHPNPLVREELLPPLAGFDNVTVTDPIGYASFCALIAASTLVLTDSGGLQEEAPSIGKPVLVMRDRTERPEGIAAGTVALVGTDPHRIVQSTSELLEDRDAYRSMAQSVNPYGDGRAAARCRAAIEGLLGRGEPMEDFVPTENRGDSLAAPR